MDHDDRALPDQRHQDLEMPAAGSDKTLMPDDSRQGPLDYSDLDEHDLPLRRRNDDASEKPKPRNRTADDKD